MPNPAAVAYEAYRTAMNRNREASAYLIPWVYLNDAEKKAWFAAASAMKLANPSAEVCEALKLAIKMLEHIDPAHEQICNGVHSDDGLCEGVYQHGRAIEGLRETLARYAR